MAPHPTPCRLIKVYMASGNLGLITSQLPVTGNTSEQHNQTNGYANIGQFMPPWHKLGLYMGVHDLRSGFAARLAYKGSEESNQPSFLSSP